MEVDATRLFENRGEFAESEGLRFQYPRDVIIWSVISQKLHGWVWGRWRWIMDPANSPRLQRANVRIYGLAILLHVFLTNNGSSHLILLRGLCRENWTAGVSC